MSCESKRPASAKAPTKEQLKSWEQNFKLIDEDGDGKVSKCEFKKCLQSCGNNPTDEEINEIMKSYDKDNNGEVSFEEFCEVMQERMSENEEDLRAAFKLFDKDHDGYLSLDELCDILFKKGRDKLCEDDRTELEEMFQEADLNHDGKISIDD